MFGYIFSFIGGSAFGIVIMCLMSGAASGEKMLEKLEEKNERKRKRGIYDNK